METETLQVKSSYTEAITTQAYTEAQDTLSDIKKAKEHLEIFLQDGLENLLHEFMMELGSKTEKLLTEKQQDEIRSALHDGERDILSRLSDALIDAFYDKESEAQNVIDEYDYAEDSEHERIERAMVRRV